MVIIKRVTVLIISAKMATLGLLKIRVFSNRYNDAIISVHDLRKKI